MSARYIYFIKKKSNMFGSIGDSNFSSIPASFLTKEKALDTLKSVHDMRISVAKINGWTIIEDIVKEDSFIFQFYDTKDKIYIRESFEIGETVLMYEEGDTL